MASNWCCRIDSASALGRAVSTFDAAERGTTCLAARRAPASAGLMRGSSQWSSRMRLSAVVTTYPAGANTRVISAKARSGSWSHGSTPNAVTS